MMKLRQLEIVLQDVEPFHTPKLWLEQYTTPPHLAACLLHTADSQFGDISGCTVADLGCGCGILSIGAALLGASYVLGVDLDEDALEQCKENCMELQLPNTLDFIRGNVTQVNQHCRLTKQFETVVMNPPYGTKRNQGIDVEFLSAAAELASNAIYSLHKTTTRRFICKKAESLDLVPQVVAELRYNIPATYKFHKQASKDIDVDFIRFSKKSTAKR